MYLALKEMPFDLATKLADVSHQVGTQHFLIIGGEPTLWRPLIEFNGFCERSGYQTVLITNGALFGQDAFWNQYLVHPNSRIGLSLKAASAEQLESLGARVPFEVVKRGIERAIQDLNATVSITYNSLYRDTLVEMVQFALDCGASTVKIDFCSTTFMSGRPDASYMIEPHELRDCILRDYPQLDRMTAGHLVFEMMVPLCLWPKEFIEELKNRGQIMSVCHVLQRKGLIFDERGNVIMCNALFDYPLGQYGRDFNDGTSLGEWLNDPKIIRYYNDIGCYPSEECQRCDWYAECGGGCPLRWALYQPADIVRPVTTAAEKGGKSV